MNKELVVANNPKSPVAENFKKLRTNIQFMNSDKEKKIFLMTSTVPGEGKSYCTANIAVAFTQLNKKVLVIDTDMRRGRQNVIFDINPRPGLSNYLSGIVDQDFNADKSDIRNFIQSTDINGLYVIPTGSIPPNPSELLMNQKMMNILDNLRNEFDVIIFDAPPAIVVADSIILTRMVDFCIIVAAQGITKKEDLMKTKAAIEGVGGKIGGVILNKVQVSGKGYTSSNYYSYYGEGSKKYSSRGNNK